MKGVPASTVFNAPWGTTLKVMTLLGCAVFLSIPLVGIVKGSRSVTGWVLLVVLPIVFLGITSLFAVRGYGLEGNTLYVQRLGWHTQIPLDRLESAAIDSHAMERSIRTWGNGGLFGFVGHFWNRKLGAYYAYATRLDCAVVLVFQDRKLVVTPDDPEGFVRALRDHLPGLHPQSNPE